MELFAIAALTHEEMARVDKRLYKNLLDECYFTFPVCFSFLGIVSLLLIYLSI